MGERNPVFGKPSGTTSEIVLIGNIMNNMKLIDEYDGILSFDDFSTADHRYLYDALQLYRMNFNDEKVDLTRLNAIAVTLFEQAGTTFSKKSLKEFDDSMASLKRIGTYQPADNEAYRRVKLFSALRQLENAGINVDDIYERSDFMRLTADEVIALVYEKLDPIANTSALHPHEDFNSSMTERALDFFMKPEIGLQTPFSFINEHMHGLCPNDFTLIGGLSNTGKGRFLMNLLVWLVAKEGQTVCLLSNEMTSQDFFKALVCTIINNPNLHDKKLRIPQTDIVQSRFKDAQGSYIERLPGESGIDFHARVLEASTECQEYEAVLKWWEETFPGKFIFLNVANDYSTPRLKQEIRRAKSKGCTVIAYDTLKGYQSSEWEDLVQAITDLSEMIKNDSSNLVGLATFQLTDDVAACKPEELSSLKIARAKGIMHLADNVLMFMPLRNDIRDNYLVLGYDEDNEAVLDTIDDSVSVTAFRIVKNRRGGGKEQIYAVQNNLDTNRWLYVGELVSAKKAKAVWGEIKAS